MGGFNPMRWDCSKDGCFNTKRRPKIELFAQCFPGLINFGDVDGLVELNGFFCLLEWKGNGGVIRTGQRISYTAFTEAFGNIVFVVEGDAQMMTVKRYCTFWGGKATEFRDATFEEVCQRMKAWVSWAQSDKVQVAAE